MNKPTTRDLAESAADLRGYANRFRTLAQTNQAPTAQELAAAADFFESVSEELLELLPTTSKGVQTPTPVPGS